MNDVRDLTLVANAVRCRVIRMLAASGSGHPGGSLSCADVLTALFFSGAMRYDREDPSDRSSDRFLLSKGHAAPALYAVYRQLGWIEKDEMLSLRRLGARLQGHPDAKFLPPVEVCSGSLGQGLAVGVGLALALARDDACGDGLPPRQVFVLCGDGELQEGSNWEAMALASHLSLPNLILLIDLNGLQIDGATDAVCSLGDLCERISAFGWRVREANGHDVSALSWELMDAAAYVGGPVALVCRTTKGKGVSFMEGRPEWHGRALTASDARAALAELDAERRRILGGGREG